nr:MAG TPA: hypothetical protein [Caudoviricetes sp.]
MQHEKVWKCLVLLDFLSIWRNSTIRQRDI